jgi:hypothetical protein
LKRLLEDRLGSVGGRGGGAGSRDIGAGSTIRDAGRGGGEAEGKGFAAAKCSNFPIGAFGDRKGWPGG